MIPLLHIEKESNQVGAIKQRFPIFNLLATFLIPSEKASGLLMWT